MSRNEKFVPTPEYQRFISALRLARQEKLVSQRELARRIGVHWSRVIRSENCERALTIIEVRDICQALDISVVEFTKSLEVALSAMEAEAGAANSSNDDATASPDNAPTASTTPPSRDS